MFKYIKLFLSMLLVCSLVYSKDIPSSIDRNIDKLFTIVGDTQDIYVKGYKTVDMRKLLKVTASIESNYGRDNYNVKHAKTPFQLEEGTAKHYMNTVKNLRNIIESRLGRKLIWNRDEDSVYVAYLVYMAKLRYHDSWLKKYWNKVGGDRDTEWGVYKIMYNSLEGKSTYATYKRRLKEMEI